MSLRTKIASIVLTTTLGISGTALACDGMGPSTHAGLLMSIDAAHHTFTIRDAQSQKPITFSANNKIITGLKDANGSIMVNYTKSEKGSLKAVGVTF
jgi:hypothetical protein